ncbi:MAG: hypothetical protein WCA32_10010 [Chromatiaceae bacterium]
MDAAEQFQQMLAAGVQFRVAGDRLGIKAPVPLTDEQRAWVRQHKTELIRQVESQTAPDLHGWTLGQIRDHCHPAEWAEIKDNRLALECVAADLRRHPFLWSPSFRGCYENHQNRPDEDVDGSVRGGVLPHGGASTEARCTRTGATGPRTDDGGSDYGSPAPPNKLHQDIPTRR